jgi:3-phytase
MHRESIRLLLCPLLLVACRWYAGDRDLVAATSLRFATYNASLNRRSEGQLVNDLSTPNNLQARRVAEIIQRVRPDVLLINEFDFDAAGTAAELFQQNYLAVAQDTASTGTAASPIEYPYRFLAESNTGVASGTDFDGDGSDDDYGFGSFAGQYGMVVYSRFPIDEDQVRTFRTFRWRDMPDNRIPDNYTQDGIEHARLSSKSHWDVPILVADKTVHILASHPTPPVFDDAVFDENGRRNADEIRFWADYIDTTSSDYIYDDTGVFGGLAAETRFVIAGDQNADPLDGDSLPGAADPLVTSPWINHAVTPSSDGGVERSAIEGGMNATHVGNPAFDTADFGSPPGNLRVDYVLPSANMKIVAGGVFWPTQSDPLARLITASDHRLVYVDVVVPEPATGALLVVGLLIAAATFPLTDEGKPR